MSKAIEKFAANPEFYTSEEYVKKVMAAAEEDHPKRSLGYISVGLVLDQNGKEAKDSDGSALFRDGPCHARLTYGSYVKEDKKGNTATSMVTYVPSLVKKDGALLEWIDWFVNRSPFVHLNLVRDPEWCFRYGIVTHFNTSFPVLLNALQWFRLPWDGRKGAHVVFSSLKRMGLNENAAALLSCCSSVDEEDGINLHEHFNSGGHVPFGYDVSNQAYLTNFIENRYSDWTLTEPKFFDKRASGQGIKVFYDAAKSARSDNGKNIKDAWDELVKIVSGHKGAVDDKELIENRKVIGGEFFDIFERYLDILKEKEKKANRYNSFYGEKIPTNTGKVFDLTKVVNIMKGIN